MVGGGKTLLLLEPRAHLDERRDLEVFLTPPVALLANFSILRANIHNCLASERRTTIWRGPQDGNKGSTETKPSEVRIRVRVRVRVRERVRVRVRS